MKRETPLLALSLLLTMGVTGCKQTEAADELVTIDVTTTYPKQELILQDIMDVEYVPLETSDDFVTQGDVMAIGNKYIIVKNWTNDGNILVFDRKTGKGVRKINRKGQSGEEYANINGIVLDEDRNELFVNYTSGNKILVYDLSGNFKRSLPHTQGSECLDVFNFDKDHLIRYDMSVYYKEGKHNDGTAYHAIISKQDGSITTPIAIPFDVVNSPFVQKGDGVAVASVCPIIPSQHRWLLVETSSDTVYSYVPEKNQLIPFLATLPTKDPKILLTMGAVTDRYYFMKTIKKVFDFSMGRGFFSGTLMYDKQQKAIFSPAILNGDFVKEQTVDLASRPVNSEVAVFQNLTAGQLLKAYENDGLKGRLKEIAAGMDEESNPVLMLVKYKE